MKKYLSFIFFAFLSSFVLFNINSCSSDSENAKIINILKSNHDLGVYQSQDFTYTGFNNYLLENVKNEPDLVKNELIYDSFSILKQNDLYIGAKHFSGQEKSLLDLYDENIIGLDGQISKNAIVKLNEDQSSFYVNFSGYVMINYKKDYLDAKKGDWIEFIIEFEQNHFISNNSSYLPSEQNYYGSESPYQWKPYYPNNSIVFGIIKTSLTGVNNYPINHEDLINNGSYFKLSYQG